MQHNWRKTIKFFCQKNANLLHWCQQIMRSSIAYFSWYEMVNAFLKQFKLLNKGKISILFLNWNDKTLKTNYDHPSIPGALLLIVEACLNWWKTSNGRHSETSDPPDMLHKSKLVKIDEKWLFNILTLFLVHPRQSSVIFRDFEVNFKWPNWQRSQTYHFGMFL